MIERRRFVKATAAFLISGALAVATKPGKLRACLRRYDWSREAAHRALDDLDAMNARREDDGSIVARFYAAHGEFLDSERELYDSVAGESPEPAEGLADLRLHGSAKVDGRLIFAIVDSQGVRGVLVVERPGLN